MGLSRINFDASLSGGTIELGSAFGPLAITDSASIDASQLSGGLTISALQADPTPQLDNGDGMRIFDLDNNDAASLIDVELIGLILTGGDVNDHGGAIYSVENLTLQGVSILENYAIGNGGGVYQNTSSLQARLLIDSSTIAGNQATLDGGGLWTDTLLPAENDLVGARMTNSTVSGNLAGDEGGGIMNFDGLLELRHVTVTENEASYGSGVVSFGDALTSTQVFSSIIAGNVINENDPATSTDDSGFDVQKSRNVQFNSFESLGYNLIGIGNAVLNFDQDDLTEVLDPKLQPLGNYGGPTTTHALLPESPAVEAGDPNLPSQTYVDGIFAGSPLLYWNLDETGGTVVEDVAGDADGTVRSAVDLDVAGAAVQTGTAASFNGEEVVSVIQSDPAVLIGTSALADTYTVSLWINAAAEEGLETVLRLQDPLAVEPIIAELRLSDGQLIYQGADGQIASEATLSSATWHHVVIVQDGMEGRMYLNGQLDVTAGSLDLGIDVDTRLIVGRENNTATESVEGFVGSLDEILIFDAAMGERDVALFYRSATTPTLDLFEYDQRGSPFERFADRDDDSMAVIDIGAFELAAVEPNADFDTDGDIDGADFLAWQRGFGTPGATRADGDANLDGDVDAGDQQAWQEQFGESGPVTINSGSSAPVPILRAAPAARQLQTTDAAVGSQLRTVSDNTFDQSQDESKANLGTQRAVAGDLSLLDPSLLGVQNYFQGDSWQQHDNVGESVGQGLRRAVGNVQPAVGETNLAAEPRDYDDDPSRSIAVRPQRAIFESLDAVFERWGVAQQEKRNDA